MESRGWGAGGRENGTRQEMMGNARMGRGGYIVYAFIIHKIIRNRFQYL